MPNCLICESPYQEFVDFGMMPIANAFVSNACENEYLFPLKLGFCEHCYMVQLVEQPERERMFHDNYAFFSSTSHFMMQHFEKLSLSVMDTQKLTESSFVVEIGCNDGIMLQNFKKSKIQCLGVEPSKNVAKIAEKKGLNVITEFFDNDLANRIVDSVSKADVILSANVMCHIPYIDSIFDGVDTLLTENGVFIFEDPYLGDVIEKTSFDQIYDEHVFLFSALSVCYLAKKHNLELVDVEHQITHGGSMRYTLAHRGKKPISKNVDNLIKKERSLGLHKSSSYAGFSNSVEKIKDDLISLLKRLKNEGENVVGYGATSKSTTVINYFGITTDVINCIYDTTPIKHYTFSPGANIPVLPYEEFRESNPDYVLLFAWNHSVEIMEKEKSFMSGARKWITYIPKVELT